MNTIHKNVVFFLLSSLTAGCRPAVKDCLVWHTVKQPDGRVVKRQVDECNHNQVLEEQEFRLDSLKQEKPDGYHRKYFPNGKLKEFSFFKRGKQDSVALFYDEKGQLREKRNYAEGSFLGPQYFFAANGALDSTEFYTLMLGKKWLTLRNKEHGGLERTSGGLLHITLPEATPKLDSLPLNAPLRLMNEVPRIDGVKSILTIRISDGTENLVDTTISNFIPFYHTSLAAVGHKFNKRGKYQFFATVALNDSINNMPLIIDTFYRVITVY